MDEATLKAFDRLYEEHGKTKAPGTLASFLAGVEHGRGEAEVEAIVGMKAFIDDHVVPVRLRLAKFLAAVRPLLREFNEPTGPNGELSVSWFGRFIEEWEALAAAVKEIGRGPVSGCSDCNWTEVTGPELMPCPYCTKQAR